jgi:hypothetical protein
MERNCRCHSPLEPRPPLRGLDSTLLAIGQESADAKGDGVR